MNNIEVDFWQARLHQMSENLGHAEDTLKWAKYECLQLHKILLKDKKKIIKKD